MLAAEQGVRNITVGYGQCGNLVQDVAAIRTLEELTNEYMHKYGYDDAVITTVFHQWMGGFPQDEAKAFGVISWGSATAALSKATKVIVKTPHEAAGVPTMEANAHLEEEKDIIRRETRCIVDKCFELGEGDLAVGSVRAVLAGVLDIPFAPSRYNAGKMLPARDNDGAIRILDMGALPFTDDIKAFHRAKIEERAKAEKRNATFQMVIDDVYAISKGRLVGRPQALRR